MRQISPIFIRKGLMRYCISHATKVPEILVAGVNFFGVKSVSIFRLTIRVVDVKMCLPIV